MRLFSGIFAILAAILWLAAVDRAGAADAMKLGPAVPPPIGFLQFVVHHPEERNFDTRGPLVVALTDAAHDTLVAVQSEINDSIRPKADPSYAWEYSTDGTGDCNKYALGKRRALLALGWPREALLLTVARTEQGVGHLVLVVRTDAGDVVLDNRYRRPVFWQHLPYRWVARQSQDNLAQWQAILPDPDENAVSAERIVTVGARVDG